MASGVLWALAYNAIWVIAWLAFMRTEWSDAAARAGSPLPWTIPVWLLWGAASAMIGIAIVAHASGTPRPLKAALIASPVVWLPLTFGMTWWGVQQHFDARVLVLDASVNLTAMLVASIVTTVLSLPMRHPARQHDASRRMCPPDIPRIRGDQMTDSEMGAQSAGEIRELARYEVRPESLDACIAAIHEFVAYVRQHEDGALRYEVWQESEHPTRFVHLFIWRDAEANRIHGESVAVKKFAGILYPNCLAPVEFIEYRQVDSARPSRT